MMIAGLWEVNLDSKEHEGIAEMKKSSLHKTRSSMF